MPYLERIHRLQEDIEDQPTLIHIPLSADLQYLTGVRRKIPTYGAIQHPGDWVEGLWITCQRGPILVLTRMTAEYFFTGLDWLEIRLLGDWANPETLFAGILQDLNAREVKRLAVGEGVSAETVIHLQSALPEATIISATEYLQSQRMIKSADEITKMRKAGEITEAAFAEVLQGLRSGITELEVVSEIDYQLRQLGSQGSSFNTTLFAVGPHHELIFGDTQRTWYRKLEPPVVLILNFGGIFEGYCSDFGRTVAFGEPSKSQQEIYNIVMDAQAAGIIAMRAKEATAAQIDNAARQVIVEAGLGEAFRHRLGHGIGLDVHEPPYLMEGDDTVLRSGMLFSVAPSVINSSGDSARVEDVVLVEESGGIPLTSGFRDLIVID
jgi:Xaa-Pro aminopeptidase